ncbi:hypothetical protein B0H16DRAFT_1670974 [Mycena metata]|uniref:Arrestin C-terminal-like domain-containing protein n=1 Tax=Mycena metata TaxID=1033252 RepID=A0AAD7P043_9AGAR|nr:hypothetical protein B0H16DRAFT_1670974 [Mycena metata]
MVKNTLTIRLTEAAVFLRTDENRARRRQNHDGIDQPGMLRGLLTLTIVKPIRITSIDLELQARSSTSWPEGIGARRIDVQEDHKLFSENIVFFRAGPAPRRNASVGPGVDPAHDDDFLYDSSQPATPRHDEFQPPLSERAARRVSADSSYFHNLVSDEPPIPPYTSLPSTPTSSSHTSPSGPHLTHLGDDPAHALEDFRNALRAGLSSSHSISGDRSPNPIPSSASSFYERDESLSGRPSMDLPEIDESRPDALSGSRSPSRVASGSNSPSRADARGRRARFSLTSVSSILRDVVHSPRVSKERSDSTARGRTREKAAVREAECTSKERTVLEKLTAMKEDAKNKEKSDSWKEFKKGTYTFPISFAIPPHSPPSMECNYGTVVWRLKANAHRPGAFASRLHAAREVIVIAAPMEDDGEENENIVVERHWEQQLQYLISISGRSFPVGGVVPVSFTFMPMAKVKIHRVAIHLEEKVEYYSQMKRVARADPVFRLQLLSIKNDDKNGGPILPLDSNDVDALKKSPLLALTEPGDDLSELASEWMGPGPWTFHQELQLPRSCARLRFTNKNKRSNMTVTHLLKCVMRVERGDDSAIDAKTGKRKLFDIVVQTPVHILSCRCNPEWMSLPQYSASFEDPAGVAPICPCEIVRRGGLERMITHHSSDSTASAAETSPIPGAMPSLRNTDSLFARNALELGEAPPAYT